MAKLSKHEVDLERVRLQYEFRQSCVNGATSVLSIVSFGVPLYCVYLVVDALAGQETVVSPYVATIVAAMLGVVTALITILTLWFKNGRQRKEILRLRQRVDELERERLNRMEGGGDD
ncbi:MAG: LapA family protein [Planctomycetota bacterium]|jgi:hypothetical protein